MIVISCAVKESEEEGNKSMKNDARDAAIESISLTKQYRGGILALNSVTFKVPRGRIVSLLGRNGAGKTTFVRIACTQLLPTSGTVKIFDSDVIEEAGKVRKKIACIPQESQPIGFLTPFEQIYAYLLMRGTGFSEARARTEEVLKTLELKEHRNTLTLKLSGGLRKRVLLGMALATDAEVLFLDEPTTGLDPVGRRYVWSIMAEAKKEGKTILITTQDMDEAEQISDEVIIMEKGTVVASGSVGKLISQLEAEVCVEVSGGINKAELRAYGKVFNGFNSLLLYTQRKNAEEVVKLALRRGTNVNVRAVSLEDVFLSLTGGLDELAKAN